jgi:hypothetical protein
VGTLEGKRPLGRSRCRWVDNIRIDLTEVGWGDHADHVAPSIHKTLALTSITNGDSSLGIVRLLTKATELSYIVN